MKPATDLIITPNRTVDLARTLARNEQLRQNVRELGQALDHKNAVIVRACQMLDMALATEDCRQVAVAAQAVRRLLGRGV